MVNFDANATQETKEFTTLPTDTYTMRPAEATVEWRAIYEDRNLTADQRQELDMVVTWEISKVSAEQAEASIETGEQVRQWIKVILDNRTEYEQRGQNSKFTNKFRDFVKNLSDQGVIPSTYTGETSEVVANAVAAALMKARPEQRVMVEEYTSGDRLRNKVVKVEPPLAQRRRRPVTGAQQDAAVIDDDGNPPF